MLSQLPCEFSDVPTVEPSGLLRVPAARSFIQLLRVLCQGHLDLVDFLVLVSPFREHHNTRQMSFAIRSLT